jgi:hypothetical protein
LPDDSLGQVAAFLRTPPIIEKEAGREETGGADEATRSAKGVLTMAIVRCDFHPPGSGKKTYVQSVAPEGRGLICGREQCRNPGLVWLTAIEAREYATGTTIFALDSATAKVSVAKPSGMDVRKT